MQDISTSFENHRIAMLIDSENAQSSLIEKMIAESGKYGLVTIRRIYGDWTTPEMKSWRETLNANAVQPIQQFRNTAGKNSTDSALIIDAMDILYEGNVNGFCLVSSDSDYTRLATRIREKGFFVMGIGKTTTPPSLVKACEVFIYVENLLSKKETSKTINISKKAQITHIPSDPIPLLTDAYNMAMQEDGWAHLGAVGERLRQLDPGFDSRTYGHKQLSQLIKANSSTFEINEKRSKDGPAAVYIKLRDEHNQ